MNNGFQLPTIEQAFLSCLMQWPKTTFPISEQFQFTNEHFQTPKNRVLFNTLNHFWRDGNPMDLIAYTHKLQDLQLLESVGGAAYVTETWIATCHAAEVAEYYAGIIAEHYAKRMIAVECGEVLKEVEDPLMEVPELIDSTVKRFTDIPTIRPHRERTMIEAVQEKLERMERGVEAEDVIRTGIVQIDRDSKLRRGDMPLIVGHRKAGKSMLALSIALNVARDGIPVLIFSLEDREPKVVDRLFAGISRIPMGVRDTSVRAMEAGTKLSALPIHIKDDCPDLSSIQATSRELKARCKIGLIVVDYAQIVQLRVTKDTNRSQQVAEISRTFRQLAMELDTPIILLSQLNQDDQTFESRALEQDATACWWVKMPDSDAEKENIRYIAIPWQRNGASGIRFKVTFLGHIARVENYIGREQFGT